MKTITKLGLPLLGAFLGFSVATQAQLKVKLEDNSNAANFSYLNGDVRIGTTGFGSYDLSISNNGTSRLGFINTANTTNGVMEYNSASQIRFQRYTNGSWNSTIMTVDLPTNRVGILTTNPTEHLHVDGTVGIGTWDGGNVAGLTASYTDGGWGVTKFKTNRDGSRVTFARNSPNGERKQIEFGGAEDHYFTVYDGNNNPGIALSTSGYSFFDVPNIVIGATAPVNSNHKLEVNGSIGIVGGDPLYIGGEVAGGGGIQMFNAPQYKLSTLDYRENFYIRRAWPGTNQGAVMGFQYDGSVTIGLWEKYDGTRHGDGTYKLMVDGRVLCKELVVSEDVPNSDHVFEADYDLKSLDAVEAFITENKHLPEIPSAQEFKDNGYSVGQMDDLLLRKVEELTLYIIAQQKEIEALKTAQK